MSHADKLLAILQREDRRGEAREARFSMLHAAIRRAHDSKVESARLIELSEGLVKVIHDGKHKLAAKTFGFDPGCDTLGCDFGVWPRTARRGMVDSTAQRKEASECDGSRS